MPQEFVRKPVEEKPGFTLGIVLDKKHVKGDVGLEIEVEGRKLLGEDHKLPEPWVWHKDPSLRGEESAEYVLEMPIDFDMVPLAVSNLFEALAAKKAEFDDSNRTSVHVHLNVQSFHLNRLTAFMALWLALEEPLVAWCGEHREGNLFCLRAIDAPATVTHLKKFIQSDGSYPLHEILRYASCNPHAMMKYGSLEIRTLRFDGRQETILDWVSVLERLYNFSAEFKDPREVVHLFSGGGPLSYFKTVLGDRADVIRNGIDWTDDQISQALFRGIRFAQSLCCCRDWKAYKAIELKPDPFGRDPRKIVQSIAAEAPSPATGSMAPMPAAVPSWANPPSSLSQYLAETQEAEESPYEYVSVNL